ncbi:hypothetical protein ZWY2020_050391 [Hordeum vulgare]|nr:hypothetical protein ZWY2020_050391 [Hordeum vulgare]
MHGTRANRTARGSFVETSRRWATSARRSTPSGLSPQQKRNPPKQRQKAEPAMKRRDDPAIHPSSDRLTNPSREPKSKSERAREGEKPPPVGTPEAFTPPPPAPPPVPSASEGGRETPPPGPVRLAEPPPHSSCIGLRKPMNFWMGKVQSKNVPAYDGAIFLCNHLTRKECFHRKLFGLSSKCTDFIHKVKSGTTLFLYDVEQRKLHGVFEATSDGAMNIIPDAYASSGFQYPCQIRFKRIWFCKPLMEGEFEDAVQDYYYFARNKFSYSLTHQQVVKLLHLFSSRNRLQPRQNLRLQDEPPRESGISSVVNQTDNQSGSNSTSHGSLKSPCQTCTSSSVREHAASPTHKLSEPMSLKHRELQLDISDVAKSNSSRSSLHTAANTDVVTEPGTQEAVDDKFTDDYIPLQLEDDTSDGVNTLFDLLGGESHSSESKGSSDSEENTALHQPFVRKKDDCHQPIADSKLRADIEERRSVFARLMGRPESFVQRQKFKTKPFPSKKAKSFTSPTQRRKKRRAQQNKSFPCDNRATLGMPSADKMIKGPALDYSFVWDDDRRSNKFSGGKSSNIQRVLHPYHHEGVKQWDISTKEPDRYGACKRLFVPEGSKNLIESCGRVSNKPPIFSEVQESRHANVEEKNRAPFLDFKRRAKDLNVEGEDPDYTADVEEAATKKTREVGFDHVETETSLQQKQNQSATAGSCHGVVDTDKTPILENPETMESSSNHDEDGTLEMVATNHQDTSTLPKGKDGEATNPPTGSEDDEDSTNTLSPNKCRSSSPPHDLELTKSEETQQSYQTKHVAAHEISDSTDSFAICAEGYGSKIGMSTDSTSIHLVISALGTNSESRTSFFDGPCDRESNKPPLFAEEHENCKVTVEEEIRTPFSDFKQRAKDPNVEGGYTVYAADVEEAARKKMRLASASYHGEEYGGETALVPKDAKPMEMLTVSDENCKLKSISLSSNDTCTQMAGAHLETEVQLQDEHQRIQGCCEDCGNAELLPNPSFGNMQTIVETGGELGFGHMETETSLQEKQNQSARSCYVLVDTDKTLIMGNLETIELSPNHDEDGTLEMVATDHQDTSTLPQGKDGQATNPPTGSEDSTNTLSLNRRQGSSPARDLELSKADEMWYRSYRTKHVATHEISDSTDSFAVCAEGYRSKIGMSTDSTSGHLVINELGTNSESRTGFLDGSCGRESNKPLLFAEVHESRKVTVEEEIMIPLLDFKRRAKNPNVEGGDPDYTADVQEAARKKTRLARASYHGEEYESETALVPKDTVSMDMLPTIVETVSEVGFGHVDTETSLQEKQNQSVRSCSGGVNADKMLIVENPETMESSSNHDEDGTLLVVAADHQDTSPFMILGIPQGKDGEAANPPTGSEDDEGTTSNTMSPSRRRSSSPPHDLELSKAEETRRQSYQTKHVVAAHEMSDSTDSFAVCAEGDNGSKTGASTDSTSVHLVANDLLGTNSESRTSFFDGSSSSKLAGMIILSHDPGVEVEPQ